MTTPRSPGASAPPTRKCPICGKARKAEHSPFCSTRCRDRDLVKWLDDGYALPGPPDPESLEMGEFGSNPQDD